MRGGIVIGVIIISGVLVLSAGATEYLSPDIVKGYSWRYQNISTETTSGAKSQTVRIMDITIDSVWGAVADTLFFLVSERDSVTYINPQSVITSQGIFDSSGILCKKVNRIVNYSNVGFLNDVAITDYDTLYPSSSSTKSCHPIELIINSVHYDGQKYEQLNTGVNTHFGSSRSSSLFVNTIGLLSAGSNSGAMIVFHSYSTTLLRYNGVDVSFSTKVTAPRNREISFGTTSAMFKRVMCRNNGIPGYNLLGQQRCSGNSGFGMLLLKELTNR